MLHTLQPKVAIRQQLTREDRELNLQPMVAPTKSEVRQQFAQHFAQAADRLPGCPKGRGRNIWLARYLGLSYESIRKYLTGEALPTPARVPGLAAKMQVSTAFLRGESQDLVLGELERILGAIPDQTVREEIVAFARFKLGGLKPSLSEPDSTQPSR